MEMELRYGYDARVRSVLARARDEAASRGDRTVGALHLLLALAGERGVLGERAEAAASGAARRLPSRGAPVGAGELPLAADARGVLELAMAAARDADDEQVRPAHLLAALSRAGGEAARVLEEAGGEGADGGFAFHIDDASPRSIHEQLVLQVQEAVATGLLSPGDRLPSVRQSADALEVAPGTVARVYGELERQGVVVTDGARGTRVADAAARAPREAARVEMVAGLLRPVVVAAYHLGASAAELRGALEAAMKNVRFPPAPSGD